MRLLPSASALVLRAPPPVAGAFVRSPGAPDLFPAHFLPVAGALRPPLSLPLLH